MFLEKLRNPITVAPEKCNIAKTQGKFFKTAIMNMFMTFKGLWIKSINGVFKYTNKFKWNDGDS